MGGVTLEGHTVSPGSHWRLWTCNPTQVHELGWGVTLSTVDLYPQYKTGVGVTMETGCLTPGEGTGRVIILKTLEV